MEKIKLQNEEFHNMYSSQDIIRIIKSRNMRWAGHEGHMNSNWKPEGMKILGIAPVGGGGALMDPVINLLFAQKAGNS
jgi:hypothetical protein